MSVMLRSHLSCGAGESGRFATVLDEDVPTGHAENGFGVVMNYKSLVWEVSK